MISQMAVNWLFQLNIYIVIYRQIRSVLSEIISVDRQARFPKLGSKVGWLKRQSKILPLSYEETSASEGNLNVYEMQLLLFTYIRLTVTEGSIHMQSLAYTLMATHLLHSLESSTLQGEQTNKQHTHTHTHTHHTTHTHTHTHSTHTHTPHTHTHIYIYIYIYMKVNMDKIRPYEGSRKNIIQIGEYMM